MISCLGLKPNLVINNEGYSSLFFKNNMLNKIYLNLKQNKPVYSILKLVSGTGLGHLLTFLALPILTRLFSPESFEVLAIFSSLVIIISSAVCFRYEIAIPLPKKDSDGLALLLISILSALIISILLFIFTFCFKERLSYLAKIDVSFLLMIPFGVFLAGSFNALQFWSTRKKDFTLIAQTRVGQSFAMNSFQVGSAFLSFPAGLVWGQLLSYSVGSISICKKLLKTHRAIISRLTYKKLKHNALRYDQYPKYSTFEVLANNAGIQLPVVLIAVYIVGPEAGYLFLALKIMQVPMALLGGSIAQVFYAEVANSDKEKISTSCEKSISSLLKLGVGPIIFIGLVTEVFAVYVFGDNWQRTGEIMALLTPWFALQFLASPISMVMHVANAQKQALILTLFGFAIRVGGLVATHYLFQDHYIEILGVASALFYLTCLLTFAYIARISVKRLFKSCKIGVLIVFVWSMFGILIKEVSFLI